MNTDPLPVNQLSPSQARSLRGVFFDIDDTLTTNGKILPCAYQSLWELQSAGLLVVPVTGRPAGWCDHIARMWPVDAVIGENGAFYFRYDGEVGRLRRRYLEGERTRRSQRRKLNVVKEAILRQVPRARIAADQPYRETDLAIDYAEDVPPLSWPDVERICRIFESFGARCKVSSIHVNGWFGDHDKLTMARILARELWGMDEAELARSVFYMGDSPNDDPMFRFFTSSAGVANIAPFLPVMEYHPTYVAERSGSEGFAEITSVIIHKRSRSIPM